MKKETATISEKQKKRTAHIVSHTHWDREWRYPIWETRLMLIDFMDELIDLLENDLYPSFLADGQVSLIFDYLEVRPEMTDRVKSLVKAGKLLVGPWYTLPDEFPLDGESMVRNLLWGTHKSQELGQVFKAGYTSFGWGQSAQLPQLYAGFGMDVAMIGKRVNSIRAPKCEFIWRAPDDTELLATRFGASGRHNFYFKIHLSALFGVDHESPDWEYDWSKGGIAYHRADREQMEQDHFMLNAPDRWYPEYITPETAEACWKTMDESVLENDRLMMNGCDYTAAQKLCQEMIAKLNEVDVSNNRTWVHTTMSAYVELMQKMVDRSKLPVVEGELRDGPAVQTSGNALSTRLYIKRKNKRAQNQLIRFAEPLSAVASMVGAPLQTKLFDKAWQFMLESHPHDSINGVTQDKTADDVSHRLDQVLDISQALGNRAMQELVKRIDTSDFTEEDILITVFNPLPYPRQEVMEAWVNVPDTTQHNVFDESVLTGEGLQIFDAEGNALGTQWQGCMKELYPVAELHTRAFPYYCKRHKIFFDTGEIPAGGYKVFRAGSLKEETGNTVAKSHSMAHTHTLLTSPNSLENEFLQIEFNPNGTFNLIDKRLDVTFRNFNYYQDRGEEGDYWANKRPMFNEVYTSLGCAAKIWAKESGPLQATLVSEVVMKLPGKGIPPQQRRGDGLVDLVIRTEVTLRAGQDQVDVMVDFENRHENHYLCAMFPTGLSKATHADAGGHFNVDHRSIRPQGPQEGMAWPDMATLPHINFVDVSDGTVGVAFLNDCLTEYEVLDNKERTVALSLLRAVKNNICTEYRSESDFPSQKGGQCLGHHTLHYVIKPHSGNWQEANIPLPAELFNAPAVPVQTRKVAGALPAKQASLFEISNPAVRFSALKKAHDRQSFILRVHNPTSKTQTTQVIFHREIRKAWLTNLNEERQSQIKLEKDNEIPITVLPCKIVTIEFETALKGK